MLNINIIAFNYIQIINNNRNIMQVSFWYAIIMVGIQFFLAFMDD